MSSNGDPSDESEERSSTSASQILSTLIPVAIIAAVSFLAFLVFRRKFHRIYQARSTVPALHQFERSPKLSDKLFGWFGGFYKVPDTHVLNSHTLDGYLFLRFLKTAVIICLVGCLITWPVLFPINATGGGGQKQLDLLTLGNVQDNYWKYLAHAGCAYVFFGFVMFMIARESIYFVNLRQAYLMSPLYAQRISSRTVLFSSIPEAYLNEAVLRSIFGRHVIRIWIPTDTDELDDMVKEREKMLNKYEVAEVKLMKAANAARLKAMKKGNGAADGGETGSVASRWVSTKMRPTHRLKPIIGQKVDTINYCRAELPKLNSRIATEQERHITGRADLLNSAFVEFDSLAEAQAAYQSLTHHQPLHMAPRYTGMVPEEIIWTNLRSKWYFRTARYALSIALAAGLIMFWTPIVAAVTSLSNIDALTETSGFGWLSFLNDIPDAILGVITGLLPAVLLAVVVALVPIILRILAKLGGDPTLSAVELTVQGTFFAFQVIQVFLIATIGSAASALAEQVSNDPGSTPSLLSEKLPKASNFFLAYFIVQGLGVGASRLLNIGGLLVFKLLSKFLDNTPRKKFRRWNNLSALKWGTVFPIYTNLLVIALCYACVAPLVLGFAAVGLYLFYLAYRYNLLYVYHQHIDTKGQVYPRALQHVFVGIYVAELVLIGLFGVRAGELGSLIALIAMIVLLVFTLIYQMALNAALYPLLMYLPKSLIAEERNLLEAETGENGKTTHQDGSTGSGLPPAPHKKPSLIMKFLRPDKYHDYRTMRRLVPRHHHDFTYTDEVARRAYYPPSVRARTPEIWLPHDPIGVSKEEIHEMGKHMQATDQGAYLDERNRLEWDHTYERPPPYEEKVYY